MIQMLKPDMDIFPKA